MTTGLPLLAPACPRHRFPYPARLDTRRIYAFFSKAPTYWSKDLVDANFFGPYPGKCAFDRKSIMLYAMPAEFFKDGVAVPAPTTLSDSDKAYVAALYPGP